MSTCTLDTVLGLVHVQVYSLHSVGIKPKLEQRDNSL